jgi:hypothetical protein
MDEMVTLEDLNCSEALWKCFRLNIKARCNDMAPPAKINDLLDIHPEADHPSGLLRRDCFNTWMFLRDLVEYGPDYFRTFSRQLKAPEVTFEIPSRA